MKNLKHSLLFYTLSLNLAFILTGCTPQINQPQPVQQTATGTVSVQPSPPDEKLPQHIPVIRTGRYTLVEVGATADQQDVFAQIIDLDILPQKQSITVADAMRYVLLNTHYQLCDAKNISAFSYFKLPQVHYQLGPVSVREALSVLAGTGWQMQVDHYNRTVCFAYDGKQLMAQHKEAH